MHQRIGYLPENPYFYDYLTAREFLDYCGEIFGLRATERKKRTADLLARVRLDEKRWDSVADLRMMGLIFKKESASDVFHQLIPWTSAGFLMMIITGSLLLWSEPVKCYNSVWFRLKVLFLFLAGLNVLIFHS